MDEMTTSTLQVSPYGFSGVKIDDLGAMEYTLVVIAMDTSGSVAQYQRELEECLKQIVAACAASSRADNLMLRLLTFNSSLDEAHGFKPLGDCNPDDYDGCLHVGGMTALNDAVTNAAESINVYGKSLCEKEYDANAILIVITDGMENDSTNTVNQAKAAIAKISQDEHLESMMTILVGVNVDVDLSQELEDFKNEVGFTQYIGLGDADAKTLARLARFVSSSISSQSKSLGQGGPSKPLTF